MNRWNLVLHSSRYHWRIQGAVALGVAAATAVLVGALLVGDSVRGSLRHLTLERLGKIDEVLVTDRFFRQSLADELRTDPQFQQYYAHAAGAILFPEATLECRHDSTISRSSSVLLIGCDESFWELSDDVHPERLAGDGEVVLNAALAEDLQASTGDEVTARFPKSNQVPADSPLAQKSDRIQSLAGLKVIDVIPTRGLGRFSLRASQRVPLVAFVSRPTLQAALEQADKVDAIFVSLRPTVPPTDLAASAALVHALHPTFEDYGFTLQRITSSFTSADAQSRPVYDYFHITTDRMILSPEAESVAREAFEPVGGQGLMTYLANTIAKVSDATTSNAASDNVPPGPIAYSMVTGIDPSEGFPLTDLNGQRIEALQDNEIVLNQWAAEDQHAQPGDTVRIQYFEPETTHGAAAESVADFIVKAITPLTEPVRPYDRKGPAAYDVPPALANDPHLTPEVKGVTDQETIDDWDAPFPFDYKLVRTVDDEYWENHRTTPKAFVSLTAADKLWGSRFGRVTSFRIPAREGVTEESLKQAFLVAANKRDDRLGMSFTPVKRRQLEASSGTTPFDVLFLGLSFFIIAAALMLVALLFRLGVEQRAEEVGILLASGWRRAVTSRLLLCEGLLVAMFGGALGIAIGIGYAWLMLAGLKTWWVGAITTPFLEFHLTARSLIIGYCAGVLVSLLTIAWSVRQTRSISVRRLLAGQAAAAHDAVAHPARWLTGTALALLVIAVGLAVVAVSLAGMAQAGAFLGGGALLLTSLLLLVWVRLRRGSSGGEQSLVGGWALVKLALRNAGRNPGRSVTTIGLMATATFLIVGLSSFRLAPSSAGAGGFDLVAQSSDPIFDDLNSRAGRAAILANQAALLDGGSAFGFRDRAGDDASCNNLYRSSQPRVLGVTTAFVEHFDQPDAARFRWMQTAATTAAERQNPWKLLTASRRAADEPIPVVIDMNTAMYSLKPPASLGAELSITYEQSAPLNFRVVGLLENSVLQGSLLIGEADFERAFPEVSGYRYFLIASPAGQGERLAAALEDRLSDQGLDVTSSSSVLEQLFAVQNTYLSTFQTLGALGLLFGTFGLTAVQMRSVLERRGELALLRATGFRRQRLARLVLCENALLLLIGLGTGVAAALLAVLPHKLTGEAAIPTALLRDLGLMLGCVLLVGLIASLFSVRATLRAPLLAALRQE